MSPDPITALLDEIVDTRGADISGVRRTLVTLPPDGFAWWLVPAADGDARTIEFLALGEGALFRVRLSAHHVIPRAEGGPDTFENLETLCVRHGRESADERRSSR